MNFQRFAGLVCAAALTPLCLVMPCLALGVEKGDKPAAVSATGPNDPAPGVSSSRSSLPDAPGVSGVAAYAMGGSVVEKVSTRPFSALAVGVKVGMGGIGFDVATPLNARMNLRGGATFLSISPGLTADGITLNGTISFKTVSTSLDIFPFGGSFRISPGLILYNGNHLHANAYVTGGQTFELNNVDYTSSVIAQVNGTFDMTFGSKVAPSLTVGFGNMIPHRAGQHWSVPVEIGFEYIGAPSIALSLSGIACQGGVNCQPIATDPTTQANVAQEQTDLNNDVSALRFYPIASMGLAYKFGGFGRK